MENDDALKLLAVKFSGEWIQKKKENTEAVWAV